MAEKENTGKRGRPKGSKNAFTKTKQKNLSEMAKLINRHIKPKERVMLAAELARGVTVQVEDGRTHLT